ncbi:hypothetical protein HZ326_19406 [Fusarium oxysporum f. sp. albedinis]|nr:hypothetical protein HZ326_19406 [Fusarium oxysporum f. sp. albedinis]
MNSSSSLQSMVDVSFGTSSESGSARMSGVLYGQICRSPAWVGLLSFTSKGMNCDKETLHSCIFGVGVTADRELHPTKQQN